VAVLPKATAAITASATTNFRDRPLLNGNIDPDRSSCPPLVAGGFLST
jgi:hypothetical protein